MAERFTSQTNSERPLNGLFSNAPERAILVGVDMPGIDYSATESLNELEQLAATAGVTSVDKLISHLQRPHPATLLGSGKIEEIADLVRFHDCDAVIFDLELTPSQHRNLERDLEIQVIDRTALILVMSSAVRTMAFSALNGWPVLRCRQKQRAGESPIVSARATSQAVPLELLAPAHCSRAVNLIGEDGSVFINEGGHYGRTHL